MTACEMCDGFGYVRSYPEGCLDILTVDCAACDGTGEAEPLKATGPTSAELYAALVAQTEALRLENQLYRYLHDGVVS